MKKVRIGISGLSDLAIQKHLPALFKMLEVEVVGAFDPDISKFDKANAALGTKLKFFNSYQDLCFACDGVIICSPESTRLCQAEIAVKEYGDPVVVEDSFAADADKIREKYATILDAPELKSIFFYDPDDDSLESDGMYQSFVDELFKWQ